MFRIIDAFLSADEVARVGEYVETGSFIDGKSTAFGLSEMVKDDLQLDPAANREFLQALTDKV